MDKHTIPDLIAGLLGLLAGLSPAALGAAVSLAYEKGLTWGERFIQFAVGTCVSFFVSRAIGALVTLDPFVLQGISFTLGMIAFKAAPKFIGSAVDAVGALPREIGDRIISWLPKKKDGQ
ncbi:hypothetical protein [Sphingomonas hylomeconis]|uniref:Holin n=1 Tax=Sphingomonas hylomeconis TaxID=1395958 RepID=A0ABV7T0H6_9SPHN|nr:hypothetical protein [Sphingomonas hylomeconis]